MEITWPCTKKHGFAMPAWDCRLGEVCGLTIPDVQRLPINYVIIFAYSTQMKTSGADRWMQDNPYSLAVTDISRWYHSISERNSGYIFI